MRFLIASKIGFCREPEIDVRIVDFHNSGRKHHFTLTMSSHARTMVGRRLRTSPWREFLVLAVAIPLIPNDRDTISFIDKKANPTMKKFLIRATLIFSGLILLALLIVIIEWHYTRAQGRKQLALVKAKLDADEPGWRYEDVKAKWTTNIPPAEQNLTVHVIEGAKEIPESYKKWLSNLKIEVPSMNGPRLHPDDIQELRNNVRPAAEACRLLSSIRHLHRGGVEITWNDDNPHAIPLTHVDTVRTVSQFYDKVILWQSAEGQTDAAIDTIRNLLHLRHAIADEPFLVSQLVRMNFITLSCHRTIRLLGWAEPRKGLAELQVELTHAFHDPMMIAGIECERAVMDRMMTLVAEGKINIVDLLINRSSTLAVKYPPPVLRSMVHWLKRNLEANQAVMLNHLTGARDALKLKGQARADAIAKNRLGLVPSLSTVYYEQFLPGLERVLDVDTCTHAQLATTIVAIACERYRQQNGRWPTTIDEIPASLLSEKFTCPFSDGPMRLMRTPTGLKVYFDGRDAKDNGGDLDTLMSRFNSDVGVELLDPAKRNQPPLPRDEKDDDTP